MFSGMFGFREGTEAYRFANLRSTLHLGQIENEGTRVAQLHELSMRVAESYVFDPKSEVLVLANNGTTHSEIQAWKDLGKTLQMPVSVWNVSLEGFVDFARALSNGTSLAQDFKGKTIVVLNNEFEVAGERASGEGGRRARPSARPLRAARLGGFRS
jgi:hypothetical protein